MTERVPRKDVGYPIYATPMKDVDYEIGRNLYRRYEGSERRDTDKPILLLPPLGGVFVAFQFGAESAGLKTMVDLRRMVENDGNISSPEGYTRGSYDLGVTYSPSDICFPYKPMLGWYIQRAREIEELKKNNPNFNYYPLYLGHRSTGTCRERTYANLQAANLAVAYDREFHNQNFDFYVAEDSTVGIKDFLLLLSRLSGKDIQPGVSTILEVNHWIGILNEAVARLDMTERFEEEVRKAQCLLSLKDDLVKSKKLFSKTEAILETAKQGLSSVKLSSNEKETFIALCKGQLDKLVEEEAQSRPGGKLERTDPEGVLLITGEIFCVEMRDIERDLVMRGFLPVRKAGIGNYTPRFDLSYGNIFRKAVGAVEKDLLAKIGVKKQKEVEKFAARGGLTRHVGGDGLHSIALMQEAIEHRIECDGIIVVQPFNCSPQVVASNIAKHMKDKPPTYELQIDEMSGREGTITRIEAFLDGIKARKDRRKRLQLA